MKTFISILLLLFGVQLMAQKPEAYELYMSATQDYNNKNYLEAIQKFNEAEEGGIQYASMYNQRGICYYQLKNYRSAIRDYEKSFRLDPSDYASYSNTCIAYYHLKEYKKAKETAQTLIKKGVYRETAFNTLGNIEFDFKNFPAAIELYRKALKYDSELACGYFNIGNSFFEMRMYDSAAVYHLHCAKLNPDDLSNLNNLAMCYSNLHKIEESIIVSKLALSKDSLYYKSWAEIGFALMDNPNYNPDEVLPYLLKATELAPDIVYYSFNNLGNLYQRKGLHNKALEAYNKSIEINPHNHKAYSGRADIYRDSMYFDRAIADFMMASQLDSTYNYPFMSLAGIMLRLREFDKAEAYYKKYLEMSPNKRDAYRIVYNAKAYNQSLIGDYAGCLENTALSLSLAPDYAYAWNNRGFAMAKTGRLDSAFICFDLSLKIDPYNSYVYHNRAFAHLVNGQPDLACADLKKAKEMHFPVRIDPMLIEFNARNCKLDFSNKLDTVIADLPVAMKLLETEQKLVRESTKPDESAKAVANDMTDHFNWVQNVFPNPAQTEFTLQTKTRLEKNLQIQVLSSNGAHNKILNVNETGKNSFVLNCSEWSNGSYFLILISEGKQVGMGRIQVEH